MDEQKGLRKVDAKWRLNIPAPLKKEFETGVLLGVNEEGCIKMRPLGEGFENLTGNLYIRELKKRRITIPLLLRSSTSFIRGRQVMIVKKGEDYELWPWPE